MRHPMRSPGRRAWLVALSLAAVAMTAATAGATTPKTRDSDDPKPKTLQVTKTAQTTYARRFDWTLTKLAAPASITTTQNTATFSYTVTATKSAPIDSGFTVSGRITVTNPSSSTVTGVKVADAIKNGPTCLVQGGSNLTIPAHGSVFVPYTCQVTSAAGGINVATATWRPPHEDDEEDCDRFRAARPTQARAYKKRGAQTTTLNRRHATTRGTQRRGCHTAHSGDSHLLIASGQAPFTFGAPASVSHDTVDVKDAFNGGTPTILSGGDDLNHSAVFTYTRAVDVPASACLEYPNVATIVSPQQLFRDASANVEACRATAAVTPTPGIAGGATPPASLRVTKRGPKIATAGTVVTFTIVVRNTSASSAATSVVLRDILPAGYSVARRPSGATFQKGRLVWSVATLPAGAAKTVRVQIRLDRSTAGTRCNTAVASAGNAPTVRARACTKVLRVLGAARVPIVTG